MYFEITQYNKYYLFNLINIAIYYLLYYNTHPQLLMQL